MNKHISYNTSGTCSRRIEIDIENGIVTKVTVPFFCIKNCLQPYTIKSMFSGEHMRFEQNRIRHAKNRHANNKHSSKNYCFQTLSGNKFCKVMIAQFNHLQSFFIALFRQICVQQLLHLFS